MARAAPERQARVAAAAGPAPRRGSALCVAALLLLLLAPPPAAGEVPNACPKGTIPLLQVDDSVSPAVLEFPIRIVFCGALRLKGQRNPPAPPGCPAGSIFSGGKCTKW